jgi:hypothetical protein
VLMMSAFQTLNKEGAALWLLYTFPVSVEQALRQRRSCGPCWPCLYPRCCSARRWPGSPPGSGRWRA